MLVVCPQFAIECALLAHLPAAFAIEFGIARESADVLVVVFAARFAVFFRVHWFVRSLTAVFLPGLLFFRCLLFLRFRVV